MDKRSSKWKWKLVFTYSLCMFGLIIFLKGFFPMKVVDKDLSGIKDIPPSPLKQEVLLDLIKEDFDTGNWFGKESPAVMASPYKKLVMVIVDAMRFDFISQLPYKSHMPFIHSVLSKGNGNIFIAKARAPTVTMPRIKALTTGSVPGYIDVVLNLDNSAELKDDNLIAGFKRMGKKMVFYGDDTWLRLFPHMFERVDGTTSFFVTDHTEVDTNVTRHLDEELNIRKDWDILILHYLGLDHIGHVMGPSSPLIESKLKEMDSVVKQIYLTFEKKEDVLMVVTSDHGMSGQGSHGGTTSSEVDTPLVFLSPLIRQHNAGIVYHAEQIDLTPSLSLLMGIPIPKSSMGKLLPSMFDVMDPSDQLRSLQYNCHHLLRKLGASGKISAADESSPLHLYRNGLQFHGKFLSQSDNNSFTAAHENYVRCQSSASDSLTSNLASYNYLEMSIGICVLSLGCCLLLASLVQGFLRLKHLAPVEHRPSKGFARTVISLIAGTSLHLASLPGSSFVEEEHQLWYFLTASTCVVLVVAILRKSAQASESSKRAAKMPYSSLFAAQLSYSSNVRLRKGVKSWHVVGGEDEDGGGVMSNAGGPVCDRNDESAEEENHFKDHPVVKKTHLKSVVIALQLIVSHRLLRSWNQTGIKYADEQDIGDWLNQPQNKLPLTLVFMLSLSVVSAVTEFLCSTRDYVRSILTVGGLFCIYLFRCSTGVVLGPWTDVKANIGLYEARVVYGIIGFLVIKLVYHRLASLCRAAAAKHKRPRSASVPLCCQQTRGAESSAIDCLQTCVILLSSLLLRPHNLAALALNLLIYASLFRLLWPVVLEERLELLDRKLLELARPRFGVTPGQAVVRIAMAYWLGQNAYFSLGNSNSLATVDLSAAYVGLSGSEGLANSACTLLLASFATYVGPIVWTTLCMADLLKLCSDDVGEPSHAARNEVRRPALLLAANTLAALRVLTLAVYVTVATGHRYHLFVWSVFSPKLLYEMVNTCVHGWLLVNTVLLW